MDDELAFTLPGGLIEGDLRLRRGRLRPLTGRLEFRLAQTRAEDRLRWIDQLLAAAVLLGNRELSPTLAAQLGEGDRQFLVLRLVAALRGRQQWLSVRCLGCGEHLDLGFDLGDMPVSEAGPGFPRCTIEVEGRRLRLRAPVSADLAAALATSGDEVEAARDLLRRCIETIDAGPDAGPDAAAPDAAALEALSPAALEAIDAALDDLCPAVATRLETVCPHCGRAQEAELDPLALLLAGADGEADLFEEVHVLAKTYHWSEEQILDLPRDRRRRYLQYIERDSGVSSGEAFEA